MELRTGCDRSRPSKVGGVDDFATGKKLAIAVEPELKIAQTITLREIAGFQPAFVAEGGSGAYRLPAGGASGHHAGRSESDMSGADDATREEKVMDIPTIMTAVRDAIDTL